MNSIESLFHSIDTHLLSDETPSTFLNSLSEHPDFKSLPYKMLLDLKMVEQSPIYHPEGNVWNHTMLVVDQAAMLKSRSDHPRVFMWAALLHDIGKPSTTKMRKGKITSYDHDIVGAKLANSFLQYFHCPADFILQVCSLVRYHMHILFVTKKMPFADIPSMKKNASISEVALLGYCDRMGRIGADARTERENIEKFYQICSSHKCI